MVKEKYAASFSEDNLNPSFFPQKKKKEIGNDLDTKPISVSVL